MAVIEKTWAIVAKGVGLPDYSAPKPVGQVPVGPIYTSTDIGELVARLGSLVTLDRRGNVIWMDNFDAPVLKWRADSSPGGTDPVLSTDEAWMGVQSAYFVTAAVANEWASLSRTFPLLRLGRIGIEFFINIYTLTPGVFRLRLGILNGTNHTRAELHLDSEARTATIVTPLGNIVVATGCLTLPLFRPFVPIKLVVDTSINHFVRLIIGPTEIDISGYGLVLVGDTTNLILTVELLLAGDAIGAMSSYVDNFILTQNEPANV